MLVLRKLKAGQSILHYVDFHQKKAGTPTMGGFLFIIPMLVMSPFLLRGDTPLSIVIVVASLGYALLGFLDDFIKIRTKNNQGLRAYQKIIGQGGIAILVAVFYWLVNPSGQILIPFLNIWLELGWLIIPLVFIALVATTNSVNLTDGVDGLAGTVTLIYLVFITALMHILGTYTELGELVPMTGLAAITAGALVCFLLFNTNKAKVFMGDTGSLYLGAFIAMISLFSYLGFFIIVLGIMFVISSLSDIIQVCYFKLTKGKRVFLMAPYHHHLEKKGFSEAKIVFLYTIITVFAGALCVWSLL